MEDSGLEYWYLTEIEECPVCGSSTKIKTRQYTKKPDDISDRIKYIQVYDHCMEME